MKYRPSYTRYDARISFWDLIIVVLAVVLAGLVYSRGHMDTYLPEHLRSEAVLAAPPLVVDAPPAPKTEGERLQETLAAQSAPALGEGISEKEEAAPEEVAETSVEVATPGEEEAAPPKGMATPLTYATLERRFLPREVGLLKATEFPVIFNGRVAGKASLPVGAKVTLVSVRGEQVTVRNGEASLTLPAGDTDLLVQAEAIRSRLTP